MAITPLFPILKVLFLFTSSVFPSFRFKHCLQKAAYKHDDSIADMVGHLYFNVIGMQCFNVEEKDYCVETSWWGRCLKSEKQRKACFDQLLTY